jgi:hypothetical protein
VYPEPFRGRAAVVEFMRKVRATVPSDLKFAVDSITDGEGATKVRAVQPATLPQPSFIHHGVCSDRAYQLACCAHSRAGAVKPDV